MIYLKNLETNEVIKGEENSFGAFFDNFPRLTESEIDAYELEQAQKEKIAQIKNTAESLILATYSTHKQRNTLMSENSQAIQTMDFFISKIRTKSNELEAALGLLSDPEEIRNFPIQFTF